jgi:hypothetical protein
VELELQQLEAEQQAQTATDGSTVSPGPVVSQPTAALADPAQDWHPAQNGGGNADFRLSSWRTQSTLSLPPAAPQ